jgi:hypothetical protein
VVLYFDGNKPSIEQLLTDEPAQRLLYTLLSEVFCLTAGQIHEFLRGSSPPGISAQQFHECVRRLRHQLVQGGYAGVASIDRLPPATISREPIFKHDGPSWEVPQFSDEDVSRFSNVARERVPPLDRHMPGKLYYATPKACEFLRSLGPTASFPISRLPIHQQPRVEQLEKMIASHPDGKSSPSAYEIACTDLTAAVNLSQMLFMDTVAPLIQAGRGGYTISTTREDARLYGRLETHAPSRRFTGLFFLGPLLPHELRERLMEDDFWCDAPSRSWWM